MNTEQGYECQSMKIAINEILSRKYDELLSYEFGGNKSGVNQILVLVS